MQSKLADQIPYKGRFAPSATGQLHLGSLTVACACALEAQQRQGSWLVRIDDLDQLRCSTKSVQHIQSAIDALFPYLTPSHIYRQSEQMERYYQVFDDLVTQGKVYQCACSRKTIENWPQQHQHQCRQRVYTSKEHAKTLQNQPICYRFLSHLYLKTNEPTTSQELLAQDSVILRKEGFFSYHFACVVDDAADQISHIIRGADLIEAALPQQYLINELHFDQPQYHYLPLIYNQLGQKLSKQNKAQALDLSTPEQTLMLGLKHLQWPDYALQTMPRHDLKAIWQWAQHYWNLSLNSTAIK